MSVRAVPQIDVNLVDYDFNQDPYPTLERIRAAGPVVFNALVPDGYMVPGYKNVQRVMGNVRKFQQPTEFFVDLFGGIVFEAIDTPRHDEIRAVWAHEFRRDTLQEKWSETITEVVDARLDGFLERVESGETVDAVANLTRGIPTVMMAHLMAIPKDDYEDFAEWSDAMGTILEGMADPSPRGVETLRVASAGTAGLNRYIAGSIEERATRPGDDLISLMTIAAPTLEMPHEELVATNTQLVFAGNETTAKLMANALIVLANHPDQRRALVADRSLLPQAIEELHRFETIAQSGAPRIVINGDAEIEGTVIPEGATIQMLIGAANRDPSRWERPDEFDIFRAPQQHLGFGFGMHSCLGLSLGRLEIQIFLDRLLDRLPEWEVDGVIDYGTNFHIRGPRSVPVAKG